jgi:hypothetical protein
MHEMDHGLGFKHYGDGIDEYAENTGCMGNAVNYQAMPRKAFVRLVSLYVLALVFQYNQTNEKVVSAFKH